MVALSSCVLLSPLQWSLHVAANGGHSGQEGQFRGLTITLHCALQWVIHIQGGGWCSTNESCQSRSLSRLGSSKREYNNNDTMDLNNIDGCNNNRWCGALMVNDPSINPLAYDWNAAFLYCE